MLKPKQRKCIELMTMGDRTQKDIAEEIGVTQATICNWKKDPVFQLELHEALRAGVRDAAAQALLVERQLLKAKSETVRLMAARDILDRARIGTEGLTPVMPPVVVISGADQLRD